MCEENSLTKFINMIKDTYSKNNCSNYKELKIENDKTYRFVPLDNSNGFIVYSQEKINDKGKNNKESLFEKFKGYYEKCKDYKKIKETEETYTHRYYYYEKISKNKNTATIIMMNPAFAYSANNDPTIKNIKDYLNRQNNKYGSFCIINLYPMRMPNSNILTEFINLTEYEIQKNQKFVIKYLENASSNNKIIAAWGSNKKDNEIAYELFKKNNVDFYCYGITKDGFPRHFSPKSYWRKGKFEELQEYKIKRP